MCVFDRPGESTIVRLSRSRRAHNPEVAGSNPAPATEETAGQGHDHFLVVVALRLSWGFCQRLVNDPVRLQGAPSTLRTSGLTREKPAWSVALGAAEAAVGGGMCSDRLRQPWSTAVRVRSAVLRSAPPARSQEAWACRRSCIRMVRGSPAACRAGRQVRVQRVLRLVGCWGSRGGRGTAGHRVADRAWRCGA